MCKMQLTRRPGEQSRATAKAGPTGSSPADYEQAAYRLLQRVRGSNVSIHYVKSHTGIRGNEAADRLANMGAEIEERHRFVERGSTEPPRGRDEHKDNG